MCGRWGRGWGRRRGSRGFRSGGLQTVCGVEGLDGSWEERWKGWIEGWMDATNLIMIDIRRPAARVILGRLLRIWAEPIRRQHLCGIHIPRITIRRSRADYRNATLDQNIINSPLQIRDEGLDDLFCAVPKSDCCCLGAGAEGTCSVCFFRGSAVVVPELDDDEVPGFDLGGEVIEAAFSGVGAGGAAALGEVDDLEGDVVCEGTAPAVEESTNVNGVQYKMACLQ